MTAAQAAVADAKTIKPRRMAFDMTLLQEKYFFRGNAVLSTFLYALSAAFPGGERFFIDSVRHFQDEIDDPQLRAQIRGFIGQEAHHTKAHEEFNDSVQALGMDMDRVLKRMDKRLNLVRARTDPGQQLAVTAAVEHITATLSQWVLGNPEINDGMGHSPLREMLIWHAVEEIEHKAVAFDVYQAAVGDEKQRIRVARLVFRTFWVQMAISQLTLLWRDRKMPSLAEMREAWNYMWGKNGVRRWAGPELKKYLRRGFHPNDIDQSQLIAHWRENHPEVSALQVG